LARGRYEVRIEGADIADVAPTVLFLRQAPIPSDVDGKILTDAFSSDLVASVPTRRGGSGIIDEEDASGFTEEEEAEIRERLEGLGYVE